METPSLQRIRYFFQLTSDSYTNPVQFPYKIEAPVPASDDKKAYIEKWLSDREAVHPLPHSLNHLKRTLVRNVLWENRDQTLDLIALSETGFVSLCTPC